jgi:hypothetical protein
MSYLIIVRPKAPAGSFLRYECIGPDYYKILSDGLGGSYAELANPATPALVRYDCQGSNRRAIRRNGTCAEFPAELANTATFVRQQCVGDALYAIRRNGSCQEYQAEEIQACSSQCGCYEEQDCISLGCCGNWPFCIECRGGRVQVCQAEAL